MVQSQVWDLEGFFLQGQQLSIVGGYNFYAGQTDGSKTLTAGDIFIDTNGDAIYSPRTISSTEYTYAPYSKVSNGLFGYDYVLDVNWTAGTYNIVQLTAQSILQNTEYGAAWNKPSNPWLYDYQAADNQTADEFSSTYTLIAKGLTITNFNNGNPTTIDTGFSGWDGNNSHYVASFDITGIDISNGATFHNTMECGNDNLIGQTAPVPEPATMFLFGTGLAGLAGICRRQKKQA